MNKIEIKVLGEFKIAINGKDILDKLSQKGSALLIYLILNGNKKLNRDHLASLFWEESSEEAARYNLRYNLWSIRKILDKKGEIIESDKNYCYVNNFENLKVDVLEFNKLVKSKNRGLYELEKAKSLYEGEFLESFFLKDCIEFNDWVFFKKEEYQKKYYDLIMELSKIYIKYKRYDDSIKSIMELLKINIFDEYLYVTLIDIYLDKGDRASAFQVYNRCVETLREELNISPSKEVKEAYFRIMNNEISIDKNYISESVNFNVNSKKNKLIFGDLKNGEYITINLVSYPFNSHKYYVLTQLIEKILLSENRPNYDNFCKCYLIDLLHITNLVKKLDVDIKYREILNSDILLNKIYKSAYEFVKYTEKYISLDIIVDELSYVDEYSFKFLLILIKKLTNSGIRITINYSLEKDIRNKYSRLDILNSI